MSCPASILTDLIPATLSTKGEVCKFKDIRESEKKGIVIIHQELALIPLLTIAENIFIGNETYASAASLIGMKRSESRWKS